MRRDRVRAGVLALATCAALGAAGISPAASAPVRGSAEAGAVLQARLDAFTRALAHLRREAADRKAALRLVADELPPTVAARYEVRLSQMERSIRDLTGKIEDLAYQVRQLEKAQKTFQSDVEFRLQELEKGKAASRRTPAPGRDTAERDPPRERRQAGDTRQARDSQQPDRRSARLPDGPPAEQYGFAIEQLRKAQYAEADTAFRAFIRRHPNHRLAGNAHYWLGEVQYVQSRYKQAAILFADGYQKFPRHAKAPDMLLKLGMTMARLDKNQEACAAFSELRRKFPDAGGHIRRAADTERQRLGCSG